MGFCQFGCNFRNFRNLSKTFLRYSRKVVSSFVRTPCFVWEWQGFLKFGWKSIKSMYYSTWVFVNLGAIFRIFETYPKRSLGTPERLWVVSSEAHVSFQMAGIFENFAENQLNPCTIVHGFLSIWVRIFRIFETRPKRFLGTPERLWVVSSAAHVLFLIGSVFENLAENQLNPCTIVHGFLSIWVRFSEFLKLVQNVP